MLNFNLKIMTILVINTEITDRLVSALCNTLVHSLWQGLLLAAVAGLTVIFTKKTRAVVRYNLLLSALVLFAISMGITFLGQIKHVGLTNFNQAIPVDHFYAGLYAANTPGANGWLDRFLGYLNNYRNTVVLIWFLIICAKCIQLATGLWGTSRLKRINVLPLDSNWNKRVRQLTSELHIGQMVTLLESGLAKVPMAIGHIKPVILIPIGLINALTPAEVEAIIVHELAHIKRRDYLVNLLQCLLEIVFFFNPAVLWVSQLIKTERENCCDDLALAQNSNKANYIRALLSCEEYQSGVPAFAMGFPGGKNSLFDRVKRMADNRNYSLGTFEKGILAICLVCAGLFFSAFKERDTIKHALAQGLHALSGQLASLKPDTSHQQGLAPLSGLKGKLRKTAIPDIIGELLKEKLITDKSNVYFHLTNKELIVNGVLEPEAVHQLLLKKLSKSPGEPVDLTYSNKNNTH
jgi:beta-lactamase regulating signal transducer with metallopeptidase domain